MNSAGFLGMPQNPLDRIEAADAVFFGAPHGTPYEGIDNELNTGSADAPRAAVSEDGRWTGHWDSDLGGPLLAGTGFALVDGGNLATSSLDGPGNRDLIREATARVLSLGAVPIPYFEAFADKGPVTLDVDALARAK